MLATDFFHVDCGDSAAAATQSRQRAASRQETNQIRSVGTSTMTRWETTRSLPHQRVVLQRGFFYRELGAFPAIAANVRVSVSMSTTSRLIGSPLLGKPHRNEIAVPPADRVGQAGFYSWRNDHDLGRYRCFAHRGIIDIQPPCG